MQQADNRQCSTMGKDVKDKCSLYTLLQLFLTDPVTFVCADKHRQQRDGSRQVRYKLGHFKTNGVPQFRSKEAVNDNHYRTSNSIANSLE